MNTFMLNKRKSKKSGWGFAPDPLAVTGGGTPPPVPTPTCDYSYYTPPSRNPGSAPDQWKLCVQLLPWIPNLLQQQNMCG